MYSRWAHLYDAIYSFKDYEAEAARLTDLIRKGLPEARSLLDVACGTGRHLEYLSRIYDAEGLDLEPALLDIARQRLPDVPLHLGDMRDFDLGRRFDIVTCLFSSVSHLKDSDELNSAVSAMARHLNSPGLLIVEPWISPEDWHPESVHAHWVDEPELKVARISVSGQIQDRSALEMHFLVGTPESVEYFSVREEMPLFTRDQYETAFRKSGLELEHDPEGLFHGRGLFLGMN